jgi:ABC-type branched-chain amino acid transport systems, periplasmic component
MPGKHLLSAAVLGASITVAGAAWAQGTVKVGMVMPMTGPLAGTGQQVIAGARLYIKQHGDIVSGKRIELIVRDDASSGETGKRLIQELIVNDKVDVFGGGLTADLMPSASLFTEAQKPVVIMISSKTAVIEKSPFFVRASCTLAQSSGILADWAVKKGLGKAVTLVTEFAPGLEAEETFTNNYKAGGGQVSEAIRVPLRSPDFAPFLQRVKEAAPQVLFAFIPTTQAATFARQFVERGLDKAGIALIGPGDLTDDEALTNMGDAMLGTVTAHFYSAAHASNLNQAFTEAYHKETKARANFMAVAGYDGMHVIYEALKRTSSSTDGKTLIAAMKGMNWESPRGPISIDPETGDIVQNIYIRKVEKVDGELRNVEFETFGNVQDPRVAAR